MFVEDVAEAYASRGCTVAEVYCILVEVLAEVYVVRGCSRSVSW